MEAYWVPELVISNGGPRGIVGQGFCKTCFKVSTLALAQHLPYNLMSDMGQWGMPNRKSEIVQLLLAKQYWALQECLILPSEALGQAALEELPVETLRVRVRILRTHCAAGPDPLCLKKGVPRNKESLVQLLEGHLNETVGQTASENLRSHTIAQLQEMLFHHWDEQVALARVIKDQGRVLRRTNPDPWGAPPVTMGVDLRYSTDGHLLLPPNPIYDDDGNMWDEVRMESDRLLAERLAAESDPWLGSSPEGEPLPKQEPTGPPAITPEMVQQAQEILKLAQLNGVVQATSKGQGIHLVPPHVQKANPSVAWSKEHKMTVDGWAMVYDNPTAAKSTQGPSESGSPPKTKSKVVSQTGGSSSSRASSNLQKAAMIPIPEETK